ncbi:MAG TPA: dTMP kinase, partial [Gammaproteobacteria bacterium]
MRRTRITRGRLITLEGVEGVGKSTQLRTVCERLREHGFHVIETREPGGTSEADEIRATLLKVRGDGFDPMAELLMMFAARSLHVD